jgi:hypothetical protein
VRRETARGGLGLLDSVATSRETGQTERLDKLGLARRQKQWGQTALAAIRVLLHLDARLNFCKENTVLFFPKWTGVRSVWSNHTRLFDNSCSNGKAHTGSVSLRLLLIPCCLETNSLPVDSYRLSLFRPPWSTLISLPSFSMTILSLPAFSTLLGYPLYSSQLLSWCWHQQ